jgi:hypothetical protein
MHGGGFRGGGFHGGGFHDGAAFRGSGQFRGGFRDARRGRFFFNIGRHSAGHTNMRSASARTSIISINKIKPATPSREPV